MQNNYAFTYCSKCMRVRYVGNQRATRPGSCKCP